MKKLGVIAEVQGIAENLVKTGIKRISILPPSEERDLLIQMGDHFIRRSY